MVEHRGSTPQRRSSVTDVLLGRRLDAIQRRARYQRLLILIAGSLTCGLVGLLLLAVSARGSLLFTVATFLTSVSAGCVAAGLLGLVAVHLLKR